MAKQKLTFSFVDPNRPEAWYRMFRRLLIEKLSAGPLMQHR